MKTSTVYLYSILLTATSFGTNLVVNGDFEQGDIGFQSNYASGSLVAAATYVITKNPKLYHGGATSYYDHTSGTGNMMAANGATIANVTVWQESINILSDTAYALSFWLSSWSSGQPANIECFINNESLGQISAPSTPGIWSFVDFNWNSQDNTIAVIKMVDRNTAPGANDFALDDIVFIPEPATISILVIGALALLCRKK